MSLTLALLFLSSNCFASTGIHPFEKMNPLRLKSDHPSQGVTVEISSDSALSLIAGAPLALNDAYLTVCGRLEGSPCFAQQIENAKLNLKGRKIRFERSGIWYLINLDEASVYSPQFGKVDLLQWYKNVL